MSQASAASGRADTLQDEDTAANDTQSSSTDESEAVQSDDDGHVALSWEDCYPILRGRVVPRYSSYHEDLHRYGWYDRRKRAVHLSLVYATRQYLPYAQRSEILALCEKDPSVARARNARLIMSDVVPDITSEDHFPYCIWYPDQASEDTYRKLAARYPEMKYSVGRACAVAGYTALYRELDLLPEVSIAEEARESDEGRAIFDEIMGKPLRYKVMDDYSRTTLDKPVPGAGLNGDTQVATYLFYDRQHVQTAATGDGDRYGYFNITEDRRVSPPADDDDSDDEEQEQAEEAGADNGDQDDEAEEDFKTTMNQVFGPEDAWLLYTPLPFDLPPINKDLLILRAAWEGNVDRYDRLRRSKTIEYERPCIVRGIYHSTSFARYWSANPDCPSWCLEAARARSVIVNDLSWLKHRHPRDDEDRKGRVLPMHMIWWPVQPDMFTLEELVKYEPRTKTQVAQAAIFCDYPSLFLELDPWPNGILEREASYSNNNMYSEHLAAKEGKEGGEDQPTPEKDAFYTTDPEKETWNIGIPGTVSPFTIHDGQMAGPYLSFNMNFSSTDLFMMTPVELLREADKVPGLVPWEYLNTGES